MAFLGVLHSDWFYSVSMPKCHINYVNDSMPVNPSKISKNIIILVRFFQNICFFIVSLSFVWEFYKRFVAKGRKLNNCHSTV